MNGEIPPRSRKDALTSLLPWFLLSVCLVAAGVLISAIAFSYPSTLQAWLICLSFAVGVCFAGFALCACGTLLWQSGHPSKPDGLAPERDRRLEASARSLSLIVGPEELFGNQVGNIRALADAERVAILVSSTRGELYKVGASRGYGATDLAGVAFREDSRLVKWLHTNETHLIPSENPGVMAYLSPDERDCLSALRVDVVFPLVALNRLVGMIFITRGGGINQSQIDAIASLGPQMALAIENAVLYEQQRVRIRRLYRAERLATVGQLAAGAAHEIRNPLTSIRSTIQYLRRGMEDDPKRSKMMGDLLGEADRINAIVEGLLSLARPADLKLEKTDLSDLVAQAGRLVEAMARKGRVEIETQVPPEPAWIQADPSQLKQVFLNVMMNALQAMPDGGRLSVRVSRLGRVSRGTEWKVEIADTGGGIAEEDREKIFDPFFTTKRDGTGLGLPISHSILRSHGGEIDLESGVGKGTRVEIRL